VSKFITSKKQPPAAVAAECDSGTVHPSLTERQQFWLNHIRRYDAGRTATKAYVAENDPSIHAMYSGRKDRAARGVTRAGGRGVTNRSFALFTGSTIVISPCMAASAALALNPVNDHVSSVSLLLS